MRMRHATFWQITFNSDKMECLQDKTRFEPCLNHWIKKLDMFKYLRTLSDTDLTPLPEEAGEHAAHVMNSELEKLKNVETIARTS